MTRSITPALGAGGAPVRGKRRNQWNQKRRELFLAALADTANVREAARAAEMSVGACYKLKHREPGFMRAWREALEAGYGELELRMLRAGLEGVETTETVREGEALTLKYVKKVHSFPFTVSVRLLDSHRGEVEAFRRSLEGADWEADEDIDASLIAEMDAMRGRLLAQPDARRLDEADGARGDDAGTDP